MATSLYCILARERPRAVILRRGGTDRVRLIVWHTDTDHFELGQWLKGRIHGDLSDLSPGGELFIYAAGRIAGPRAENRSYGYGWTAVSRPPYLTALALWPASQMEKGGSIFDGGGLFVDDRTVILDHVAGYSEPHPDHRPPRSLRVVVPDHPHKGLPDPAGQGLLPLEMYRMLRDGWKMVHKIRWDISQRSSRLVQPWLLERPAPMGGAVLVMEDSLGYGSAGTSRSYLLRFPDDEVEIKLEGVRWADWDHRGRLTFSREGELLACDPGQAPDQARVLADLKDQRFENVEPPDWAVRW